MPTRVARVSEVPEIESWIRVTLMLLSRLATASPEDFAAVVSTLDSVRDSLPAVMSALREHGASEPARHGRPYTWQEVADALGVSRQAATERFGRGLR